MCNSLKCEKRKRVFPGIWNFSSCECDMAHTTKFVLYEKQLFFSLSLTRSPSYAADIVWHTFRLNHFSVMYWFDFSSRKEGKKARELKLNESEFSKDQADIQTDVFMEIWKFENCIRGKNDLMVSLNQLKIFWLLFCYFISTNFSFWLCPKYKYDAQEESESLLQFSQIFDSRFNIRRIYRIENRFNFSKKKLPKIFWISSI